jgi:hypothetical protein
MDNVSKVLFKEIMTFVREFESLGNKWCEENDLNSVARARSYGKKIMTAMKPFIEESIKETDAAVAAEVIASKIDPVVEEVKVVEDTPVVEEPVAVEAVVEVSQETLEKKETEVKTKGFGFNKRK